VNNLPKMAITVIICRNNLELMEREIEKRKRRGRKRNIPIQYCLINKRSSQTVS